MAQATLTRALAVLFGWFRPRATAVPQPPQSAPLFPARPPPLTPDSGPEATKPPTDREQARAAEQSGDAAAAALHWQAAWAADPADAEAPLRAAEILLRQLNCPGEARDLLGRAAERFGDNVALWRAYAECASLGADHELVARASHRLAELEPGAPFWPAAEAAALRDLDRLEEADSLLVAAIVRFPPDQALLTTYAWVANYRGDWAEALRRWQGFLFHFKSDEIGAWLVGQILAAKADQPQEADDLLATATWRFPDNLDVAMAHARLPSATGDWPESFRRWDDLFRGHPDQPAIEAGRAEAALHLATDAPARPVDG